MGPREADAVAEEILRAHTGAAVQELDAWVVMPNHVHLLVRPKGDLTPVLRGIKGASARRANLLRNRRGGSGRKSLSTAGFGTNGNIDASGITLRRTQ